jgi:hypothetical protein
MATPAAPPELEPVLPQGSQPPYPLLSPEQLESHAQALAAAHGLSADPRRARPLLPRLDDSAARLEAAYQFLSGIARADPQPVASEDWRFHPCGELRMRAGAAGPKADSRFGSPEDWRREPGSDSVGPHGSGTRLGGGRSVAGRGHWPRSR